MPILPYAFFVTVMLRKHNFVESHFFWWFKSERNKLRRITVPFVYNSCQRGENGLVMHHIVSNVAT